MANDPNRDVLPVKEESNCRTGKGYNEKVGHQVVKLTRCELQDRVLSLFDENTQLKKLVNCQEETAKRLHTKLQRLTAEKKSHHKSVDNFMQNEELNLRIIKLEHENYTLKDKNIVLKQQLANHARHISVIRSPLRSMYTSPLMSVRQLAPPQTEMPYNSSNVNTALEYQTRDGELNIKQLHDEIRALHSKVDYLQQDMERSSLNYRKTKVTENIELIRLQRSLKQQAIQIGKLQAQVRTSENNQKLLKEELLKAHDENDEAMNVIKLKQNEILNLCTKLEKKNLNRFEEEELRERINDLMKERDALKERSDLLLKTVTIKTEEVRRAENLKKLLAEEKIKKERLENTLKKTESILKNLQDADKSGREPGNVCSGNTTRTRGELRENADNEKKKKIIIQNVNSVEVEKRNGSNSVSSAEIQMNKDGKLLETHRQSCSSVNSNGLISAFDGGHTGEFSAPAVNEDDTQVEEVNEKLLGKIYNTDKVKMERELQHLREMLRSQSALCAVQQTEINRLMQELKVNEEKYGGTMQKLESYLNILDKSRGKLQKISKDDSLGSENKEKVMVEKDKELKVESQSRLDISVKDDKDDKSASEIGSEISRSSSRDISALLNGASFGSNSREKGKPRPSEFNSKKRFVDQVFLESSDEDDNKEDKLEKATFIKKFEGDATDVDEKWKSNDVDGLVPIQRSSSLSPLLKKFADDDLLKNSSPLRSEINFEMKGKKANNRSEDGNLESKSNNTSPIEKKEAIVEIGIVWLQLNVNSLIWRNDEIKLIFVDFSFLGIIGEETETPNSLPKPNSSDEKCEFDFFQSLVLTQNQKEKLKSSLVKPDLDLIVFKVISDPENSYENLECEEIGVAVVTVKQFLNKLNHGPFVIPIRNMKDFKEVIGKLAVSISATSEVLNLTN